MAIRWDSESDWENSQDSSGTVGRNGNLRQGYSREKPPLSQGLVGYWPLHDDSATDYSGNNNHGTLNGGVTTGIAGKAGLQAMSFDGSDDSIDIPDQLLSNGSSLTLSFWFKADTLGNDDRPVAISQSHECLANIGRSGTNEIGVRWRAGDGNARDYEFKTISTDTWHHYAVTYDSSSGDLKGYLNSTEQLYKAGIGSSGISQESAIGQKGGTGYFNGKISDVRIYNRTLSLSEINTLYEWGSGDYARPPNDGTAYYKFDGDGSDSWGSNSTTNSGVVFSSDSVRNQSGEFQASNNDRVVIDNSESSSHPLNVGNLAASDFTVSTWVKFDSFPNTNNDIIGSYDGAWYMLWYNTGTGFRWGVDDGSNKITADGGTAQTETWYHLTGTYDSSEKKAELYLNSSKIAEGSNTSFTATASSNPVHIGDGGSGRTRPLNGHIDDLRIYDRKLRPEEIFELYRYGTRGRDLRKFLVTH
ncbi:LamG domain-containing protein [Candidatus Nanosalina sp. VS9-1]|uniref:LamG domain-containing protein n=1 Tax=Candidatus Nanosalina sp. VS9-1 TaxID=3388566 RepID=UPI0039E0A92E